MASYLPLFDPNSWYQIIYAPDGSAICAYLNLPYPPGVSTCARNVTDASQQFQIFPVPDCPPQQPVYLIRNHLAGSTDYFQALCNASDCDWNTVGLLEQGNLTDIQTISKWTFVPSSASNGSSHIHNAAKGTQFVLDNSDHYIHMTDNLSNPGTGNFAFANLGQIQNSTFILTTPSTTSRSTKAAIAVSVLFIFSIACFAGWQLLKCLRKRRHYRQAALTPMPALPELPQSSRDSKKTSWMQRATRIWKSDARRRKALSSKLGSCASRIWNRALSTLVGPGQLDTNGEKRALNEVFEVPGSMAQQTVKTLPELP